MQKFLTSTFCALVLATAAQADSTTTEIQTPGVMGLSADGTWDCTDPGGVYLGAVVVAELTYAFLNPEGKVGAYGKLNMDEWMDVPAFYILSGELKDKFGAAGLSMIGPENKAEDFTDWNKLRLKIVVSPETIFYCARRNGPAI